MEKRFVLIGGLFLIAGIMGWANSNGALEASELNRSLADFHLEQFEVIEST